MISKNINAYIYSNTAKLSDTINFFKGDGDVDLNINLIGISFKIEQIYSDVKILVAGREIITDRVKVVDNIVKLNINKNIISQALETGEFKIQIRLWDELVAGNRIALPVFFVTVREELQGEVTLSFIVTEDNNKILTEDNKFLILNSSSNNSIKISELEEATELKAEDFTVLVQDNTTKKIKTNCFKTHTHSNLETINKLTEENLNNMESAYTHSTSAHAPANAQKNSDITKAEIEAKLTGDITSHTHTNYATKEELNNKVDKAEGKSLLEDTKIERLKGLKNYDDTELKESIKNKAGKNHAHDNYATTIHSHAEYAGAGHNHDNVYAKTNHTHEGFANVTHTHTKMDITNFPTKLSQFENDLNISNGGGSTGGGTYNAGHGIKITDNTIEYYEGQNLTRSGVNSHAEGHLTKAIGRNSHSEGFSSKANGVCSHAGGNDTIAYGYAQTTIGAYNIQEGNETEVTNENNLFIIGNGSSGDLRSNAFRVTHGGQVYGKGAYNTEGADYAEFFEWEDSNSENEDRVGYFVTFSKGEKIRKATSTDNYILGVVSANPAIIGDNKDENWNGKYVKDNFGRIKYEIKEIKDEQTGEIYKIEAPVISEEFRNEEIYKPRRNRREWSTVGMMGKLLVYDDGSCVVGGFCKVNDEGKATKSTDDKGYYVMQRTKENIIKILFK